MVPVLVLLSYVVAFTQRPGKEYTDSRIELSVDPALFLRRVVDLWSPTTDLGHVHAGQSVGYLFPMGPWYALMQAAGVPMWVAQRLWLGTLLALAAWGAVRLLDVLFTERRGVAHLAAGVLYGFNPYVAMFTNRASVALLAYVVLPWLMFAVHRGLRDPRRWRYPALFGLLLAASGGGANATLIAITLPAPALLLAYERWVLGRPGRDAWGFAWRAAVCGAVASAWWFIPLVLSSPYARDFLSFTEQPNGIWATSSMSEALRLLGYWPFYLRLGFDAADPVIAFAEPYLRNPLVILAGFLVPLAAFGGLRWTSRWGYAPLLGLLAVGALVVMAAGFPEGSPPRALLLSLYYGVEPLQILRTTYKAAPVLALSLALLGGVAVARGLRWALPALRRRRRGGVLAAAAVVAVAAVPVVAAWPLFTGEVIDEAVAYDEVPQPWEQALSDAARRSRPDQRIMVLPGELFGAYRWGFTNDPVAPAIARRPVLVRSAARYADPRAAQLQVAVDDLVQQVRLVPGQLEPLLRLLGVGQVVVAADGRRTRNWALDPIGVTRALAEQPQFTTQAAAYGGIQLARPELGRSGPSLFLPDLRRYAIGGRDGDGMVRAHPQRAPTVLDGDAQGLVQLAAGGDLRLGRALFYAGDLDRARVRAAVAAGGRLVFTDSNRRRPLTASRTEQNYGATVPGDHQIDRGWPRYEPFAEHGTAAQTVARYDGVRATAPLEPGLALRPEHRPYAAIDGRPDTSWLPGAFRDATQRRLDLRLDRPRVVRSVRLLPHADRLGATRQVAVSVNGEREERVTLRDGWNELRLDARQPLRTLSVRIVRVDGVYAANQGGVAEVQLPGGPVRESLRLPTLLAERSRGLDLSRTELAVALERTTADDPTRVGGDTGDAQAGSRLGARDPERGIERDVTLPEARAFTVAGWASVAPEAPDRALDALAGLPADWRFESSSRFEGVPRRRASSAFDADPSTSWIADLLPGRRTWIAVRGPREVAVDRLRLQRGPLEFAFPRRVRVVEDGGRSVTAITGVDGRIRLGRTLRTRSLRIDVLDTYPPPEGVLQRTEAVAVREVVVPGLRPPAAPAGTALRSPCGAMTVAGRSGRADLEIADTRSRFERGLPLRLRSCGSRALVALEAGTSPLSAPPGEVFRPDHLLLRSTRPGAAPAGAAADDPVPVRVTETSPTGLPTRAAVSVTEPSWVVLGQSFAPGWRAECRAADGTTRPLGEPTPIDGYANGWRVEPSCREVAFDFAPQRIATAGYALSGVGLLALVGVFLAPAAVRRRLARGAEADPSEVGDDAPVVPSEDAPFRLAWPRALAVAALVAAVAGLTFALRMGAALGLLTLVLLVTGVTVARLLKLATLALVVVTGLYVIDPLDEFDNPFYFAQEHLDAHWFAIGAACCLGAACLILTWRLRRASAPSSGASD